MTFDIVPYEKNQDFIVATFPMFKTLEEFLNKRGCNESCSLFLNSEQKKVIICFRNKPLIHTSWNCLLKQFCHHCPQWQDLQ